MLFSRCIWILLLENVVFGLAWVSENKLIEDDLLKNYDKRHRPVRSESTTMKIQVFLMINHIEKVDEREQTMLLHGILWASWIDEYLKWMPTIYNNTLVISIEAWKIWQPTFALYNSARSNDWFVYMNGVPATVGNNGRVFAAGTFSFYVTCQFDFSNYPYDEQECPIVLADWIYDLSKVNLSDPASSAMNIKPALRLSFDPLSDVPKNHVAGWELLDSWQKHCYWGPNGCADDMPIMGPLDNYWSLLEFGVKIRRHAAYYGLTLLTPALITMLITLLVFWLENLTMAIVICVLNILLQAFVGLSLVRQLPPGNGSVPKIAKLYAWNLIMAVTAYAVHVLLQYCLNVAPENTKLPQQLRTVTGFLTEIRFFKLKGFSAVQKDGLSHYTADGGKLLLENTANKGVGTQRKQAEHYDGVADTTNRLIIEMEPIFDSECADDNDRNGCDKKVARHQEPAPLQPIFDLDLSDASPAAVAGNTIGGEMESVLTQKEDKRSLVVCDRPEESHQLLSFAVGRKWISNKLRKVVELSTHDSEPGESTQQRLTTENDASSTGSAKSQSSSSKNDTAFHSDVLPSVFLAQKIVKEQFCCGEFDTELFLIRRLLFIIFAAFFLILAPSLLLW